MVSICQLQADRGDTVLCAFLRPLLRVEGGQYMGFPRRLKRGLHRRAEPSDLLEIPSGQSVDLAVIFQQVRLVGTTTIERAAQWGYSFVFTTCCIVGAAGAIG